ncbi:ABC transporter ATP-binding protein [Hyphomicrobium facile]|uniref:NitT/TauT family transport system ATP-binding protein n=1 Tax=Hyphomicrobium facile TaxID=51670 RepID=A0A1I7MUT3_9HYPH|nr:ABC transporter ATP-binding protein [Hyphomicrobium facile]SFV26137.1 NitT/TauT family transport system ATP-binding protein [Hyphomicrobium facile]
MSGEERLTKPELGRIEAEHVSIRLGFGHQAFEAVQDVSFDVEPGELVCLIGPSGCGKSTLLGALAGHITPSGGTLKVDGLAVRGPHPDRGIVFQHHTLFPWKSALANVAFGPKMRGVPKAERKRQAIEILDLIGLGDFADRYPKQLSGGMQQRVEIARVLVNKPRLLLMDEPFGALDALTRLMMQELLLEIWARVRTTVLFVTHDIDEALFLADRIIVMTPRPGRLLEIIRVPFVRPRPAEIVATAEFGELKRHCLELLRGRQNGFPLPRLSPLGSPPQS